MGFYNERGRGVNGGSVTPSDTTAVEWDALWIGTGGNVAVILSQDTAAITFTNVPSGSSFPYAVKKVMSTNTTASGILGIKVQ